ncbi:hypothetical protein COCC4DRAFT_182626, partial [Bipolaris maydis ATCC 48331]
NYNRVDTFPPDVRRHLLHFNNAPHELYDHNHQFHPSQRIYRFCIRLGIR